jgi:hypothetical protein
MARVTGTIQQVQSKPFSGGVNYQIEVDGQRYGGFPNANDGVDLASLVAGDKVSFEVTEKGKYKNFSDLVIESKATKAEQKAAETVASVGDEVKQYRIQLQAAAKIVGPVLASAVQNGAIKLPAEAKRWDYLMQVLRDESVAFADWVSAQAAEFEAMAEAAADLAVEEAKGEERE